MKFLAFSPHLTDDVINITQQVPLITCDHSTQSTRPQ